MADPNADQCIDDEDPALSALIDEVEGIAESENHLGMLEACSRGIIEFPAESRFYYHRAQAKKLLGDDGGAIEDLTRAIALKREEPAFLFFKGLWQLEAHDYSNAVNDLTEGIEAEARIGSSYYMQTARFSLAIALLYLGEFSHAEKEASMVSPDLRMWCVGRLWNTREILDWARNRRLP